MAQLGNRLLRYEICGEQPSIEELVEFIEDESQPTIEAELCKLANDLIEDHFLQHPVGSVDPKQIIIPRWASEHLARLGLLIATGRVEVEKVTVDDFDSSQEYVAGQPEGPHRVILVLKTVLQGLALLEGRQEVIQADFLTLRHICLSSIPRARRKILREIIASGGALTSTEAETSLGITRPTARSWMRELAATGIVKLEHGEGTRPDRATINPEWEWLLIAENEMHMCEDSLAASQ